MFGPNGPSLLDLAVQAMSSTEHGYDLLAPRFDYTPFRTASEVLEIVQGQLERVDAALDLGCGTGAVMEMLLPLCRRRLVGLDFSQGMLDVARCKVPGNGVHPEFVRADILDVPFRQEFELVTCFGAFGHVPADQEPRFVRQVYNSLVPGGRFVGVSAYHPRLYSVRFWRSLVFNAVMRVRNALYRPPFIMYYMTFLLPHCAHLLEAHGFEVELRGGLFPAGWEDLVLVVARKK